MDDLPELETASVHEGEWITRDRFGEGLHGRVLFHRDGLYMSVSKYDPGQHNFAHKHDFPQVRFILEGELTYNGKAYGPGTALLMPENTMYEMFAPEGGTVLTVQFPTRDGSGSPDHSYLGLERA